MPSCRLCKNHFPIKLKIDGKIRNLQNRKYCLKCSPFGSGNTCKLEKIPIINTEKKKRDNKKYRKWQRKARKERKQRLVEISGGKCVVCGYSRCIKALEFHHIDDKEEKSFGLTNKGMLTKWDKLLEEIKKCVLVCSNCHREVHTGMHQKLIEQWNSDAGLVTALV